MRNAAGELAHRFHLLRLAQRHLGDRQLFGGIPLSGDVAADAVDSVEFRHANPRQSAITPILAAIAVLEIGDGIAGENGLETFPRSLGILGVQHLEDRHRDKFGLAPAKRRLPCGVRGFEMPVRPQHAEQVGTDPPHQATVVCPLDDATLNVLVQRIDARLNRGARLIGADALRDVVTAGKDTCDLSRCIPDWLIKEIDETIPGLACEADRHGLDRNRFTGRLHAVQRFEESLAFQLGKHFANVPPDEIATPHHFNIGVVHILEDVVRPGQYGNEARHLLQERQLAVAFGAHCGLRLVLLGDILTLKEDARYLATLVDDRLVGETQKDSVGLRSGRALQVERNIARHVRLACREGMIECLEQASALKVGKGRAHCLADEAPLPSDAIIGIIYIFENVVGSAQDPDETGNVLEQQPLPLALSRQTPVRQHSCGGLRGGAEQAGDFAALVAHRRVGKGEPTVLGIAVALQHEVEVFGPGRLAAKGRVDQWRDFIPDFRPDFTEWSPERPGMLFAEHRPVGVVVQELEIRTPCDKHDLLVGKHHAHGRSQGLRPCGGMSNVGSGPVMGQHQRAHFAAACKYHVYYVCASAKVIHIQGQASPASQAVRCQGGALPTLLVCHYPATDRANFGVIKFETLPKSGYSRNGGA